MVETKDCNYTYRIHPDDEHLAYGPISTALRQGALYGDTDIPNTVPHIQWGAVGDAVQDPQRVSEETRAFFLLILAEALADEGL